MVNPETRGGLRRRWLFPLLAGTIGLGGGALTAWWRLRLADPQPQVEEGLWSQSFETSEGQQLAMAGFRGRPLLLNFWATWCPPCVEELPLLNEFFKDNAAQGWQVAGLALDKAAPVKAFLSRAPLDFPVVLGGAQGLALSKSLGNLTGGLPFSVLFGSDGRIQGRKLGKLTAEDLQRWREVR